MTDNYSGQPEEEPQALAILKQVRRLGSSTNVTPHKPNDNDNDSHTYEELYRLGKEQLAIYGIFLELESGGNWFGHSIYIEDKPPMIMGLSFPIWFKPYRKVYLAVHLNQLEFALNQLPEGQIRDFWKPLLFSDTRIPSPLQSYCNRLKVLYEQSLENESQAPIILGHTFDADGQIFGSKAPHPKTWVPAQSWFKPSLKDLTFEQIFNIFPPAETALLKLIIGRIGTGRTNQVLSGTNVILSHTARMAAVIVGKEAGLGKSTLFNAFHAAIAKCGFQIATFKDTASKFGLKTPALAHVAYKDDINNENLKEFLKAEETKILVTGGIISTEQKFENPEKIRPNAVLIINANNWDASLSYQLDPGIVDRIKILTTLTTPELPNGKDSRPYYNLPKLAEQYDVDVDTLMLWALRLATDHFYNLACNPDTPNALENEVKRLTGLLHYRFKSECLYTLIRAMAFCKLLLDPGFKLGQYNLRKFFSMLKAFYLIGTDLNTNPIIEAMKADFEQKERINSHFYWGFKEIKWNTIGTLLANYKDSETESEHQQTKQILSFITLRDGFQAGSGYSFFIEHWNNINQSFPILQEEVTSFLTKSPELIPLFEHLKAKGDPDNEWLFDDNYDPISAHLLKIQYQSMSKPNV